MAYRPAYPFFGGARCLEIRFVRYGRRAPGYVPTAAVDTRSPPTRTRVDTAPARAPDGRRVAAGPYRCRRFRNAIDPRDPDSTIREQLSPAPRPGCSESLLAASTQRCRGLAGARLGVGAAL